MYKNGQGVPRDHAEALHRWRKAAEHGHASAQFKLGDAIDAKTEGQGSTMLKQFFGI